VCSSDLRDCFNQCAGTAPSMKQAVLWNGFAALASGANDSAAAAFKQVGDDDPGLYVKSQVGLGMALSAKKEYDAAGDVLKTALDLKDNTFRSSAYYQLIANCRAVGDDARRADYANRLRNEFPASLECRSLPKEAAPTPAAEQAGISGPATAEYAVQIGAFTDKVNAKRLLADLRKKYHHVEIREKKGSDSRTIYGVLLGSFETREKAAVFADEEVKTRFKSYIIIEK
jgi:tetratricopeptide (TPR) repeat protein